MEIEVPLIRGYEVYFVSEINEMEKRVAKYKKKDK